MSNRVKLVVPYAPPPVQAAVATVTQRNVGSHGIRLGILDNSKSNADHLLQMIVEGVRAQMPLAAVVRKRKPYVSMAAPPETLNELAREADVVISAMAD